MNLKTTAMSGTRHRSSDRTLFFSLYVGRRMPALWTYPWTLAAEGPETAFERIAGLGVDQINLATHYHSVRSMQPRLPDHLFVDYSGGCYFDPDRQRFADTPIDPVPNRVPGLDDPLAELAELAADHDIDTNAWVVLFHNSRLGAKNPNYCAESAFGDQQDHALCPSHEAVRDYFAAVVSAAVARGAAEVQLEKLGYPTVFHGHGASFGHDKRQVLMSHTEELLLSQCFCDGCRDAAKDYPVELTTARDTVQRLLRKSFASPHVTPPSLDSLVHEYPELQALFDFRTAIINDLSAGLERAAAGTPLNYYIMDADNLDPGAGWSAGVNLREVTECIDRVTALCYVGDPDVAQERIERAQRLVDCRVDAGVTLDPETIGSQSELFALVDGIRSATDGRISIYHDSLLTDAQLEWVRNAFKS